MNIDLSDGVDHVDRPRSDHVDHVEAVRPPRPYRGRGPRDHVHGTVSPGPLGDPNRSSSSDEEEIELNAPIEAVELSPLGDFIKQAEMQLPQWLNAVCSQE